MIELLHGRLSPIGLDIGARVIKAIQCRRVAGGQWKVSRSVQVDRAEPGRPLSGPEAQRIADVLRRQGFSGGKCVIAAGQPTLLSACLELPPRSSGAPLEQIAAAELGRTSRCDPASLQVATWDLPTAGSPAGGRAGATCMAVACRTEEMEAVLDSLESAGLSVSAVDVQACALQRACGARLIEAGSVLDIGAAGSLLVAVRGGVVVFQRHLADSALSGLFKAMAAKLGVDEQTVGALLQERAERGADAWEGLDDASTAIDEFLDGLSREVSMSLSYLAQKHAGAPVGGMMVCGGGAVVPGLVTRLASALGLEIELVTPQRVGASIAGSTGQASADDPSFMCALGLAMHPQGGAL